jgi:hypothetical protein
MTGTSTPETRNNLQIASIILDALLFPATDISMKGPWPRFVRTQLSVKVIYYVWPLTCPFCTRHQTFRMEGASDEHGKMHWAFVG